MATNIVYEDAFIQVVEETSDSPLPGEPGGWRGFTIINKPGSPGANKDELLTKAAAALAANATFLAIPSATAAQTLTQVRALSRQVNALIRITIADFTTIDNT